MLKRAIVDRDLKGNVVPSLRDSGSRSDGGRGDFSSTLRERHRLVEGLAPLPDFRLGNGGWRPFLLQGGGQQSTEPPSSLRAEYDCHRFANLVQRIETESSSDFDFYDRLARTFTAANDSTISEMQRTANFAIPNDRPQFTNRATGFKKNFRDHSNQVRHATAGVISGFRLGSFLGRIQMNSREDSDEGRADIALNNETTSMGAMYNNGYDEILARGYNGLAQAIRKRLCE